MVNSKEPNKLLLAKTTIDNKLYNFLLTNKQFFEFLEILKTRNMNEAIQYMQLHFGYFVNIDYKKTYDCFKIGNFAVTNLN